ncbi:MAG: RNHCP domain-containing protein [Candidatus Peregrinibacteria bacterium]
MIPFLPRQEPFVCNHCGVRVEPLVNGSCRNHCPQCLWSKHVDEQGPGDRVSLCEGPMEPIGSEHRGAKGWMIVHRCLKCGKQITNILAPDDDLSVFSTLIHERLK